MHWRGESIYESRVRSHGDTATYAYQCKVPLPSGRGLEPAPSVLRVFTLDGWRGFRIDWTTDVERADAYLLRVPQHPDGLGILSRDNAVTVTEVDVDGNKLAHVTTTRSMGANISVLA